MSDAKKVRAAPGDLVTFQVGGRWILAEVLTVSPEGYVQASSNMAVRFELDKVQKRWVFSARRMSQPDKLRAYVRTHKDNSFETLRAASAEVFRWVREGTAEIETESGENILEELT